MSEDNLSEKTAPTDDEFEYENDSDDIELYAGFGLFHAKYQNSMSREATGSAQRNSSPTGSNGSNAGSTHALKGSDVEDVEDPVLQISLQCYNLNGEPIGEHFTIIRNASIGHLIHKLRKHADVTDEWLEDKEFVIGGERFSFRNAYTILEKSRKVRKEFSLNAGQKVTCQILSGRRLCQ